MQALRPRRAKRELTKVDAPNAARVGRNLGDQIRAARIKNELTQTQLAEITRVCPSQIGHIEIGRNFPSIPLLVTICRALKLEVSVGEL